MKAHNFLFLNLVPQPKPRSKTSPKKPQRQQPKKQIVQSYDEEGDESNVRRAYRARY